MKGQKLISKAKSTVSLSPLEESYKYVEPPEELSEEERSAWIYLVDMLKSSTRYKKTPADTELIRQFVQHKVIRIVTGICADGTTPKIVVKENEHYRILNDCNRYIEKLLNDLKLTPLARSPY